MHKSRRSPPNIPKDPIFSGVELVHIYTFHHSMYTLSVASDRIHVISRCATKGESNVVPPIYFPIDPPAMASAPRARDVDLLVEQTGHSRAAARRSLVVCEGDLVDALMHLHELTPPASEDGGSGDDGESKDAEESTGTGT